MRITIRLPSRGWWLDCLNACLVGESWDGLQASRGTRLQAAQLSQRRRSCQLPTRLPTMFLQLPQQQAA